jgi:hypothetical protein
VWPNPAITAASYKASPLHSSNYIVLHPLQIINCFGKSIDSLDMHVYIDA